MRIGEVLVEQHRPRPTQSRRRWPSSSAAQPQARRHPARAPDHRRPKSCATADRTAGAHADGAHRRGADRAGLHHRGSSSHDALAQQNERPQRAAGRTAGARAAPITRDDLQTALARKMGYPLVDVQPVPARGRRAGARCRYAVARRLQALPLMLRGGRLVVAMEDPSRRAKLDEIEFAAQCKVVPVLARAGALPAAIDQRLPEARRRRWPRARRRRRRRRLRRRDASKLLASLEQQRLAASTSGDGRRRRSSRATTRWCG